LPGFRKYFTSLAQVYRLGKDDLFWVYKKTGDDDRSVLIQNPFKKRSADFSLLNIRGLKVRAPEFSDRSFGFSITG